MKIKNFLPQNLLGRTILIVIFPFIMFQLIILSYYYNSLWERTLHQLSRSVVQEITLVSQLINSKDYSKTEMALIEKSIGLEINLYEEKPYQLNEEHKKESIIFQTLRTELSNSFKKEIYIKDLSELDKVLVVLQFDASFMEFIFYKKRINTSRNHIFLGWQIISSLILIIISMLFLKNQIKPINLDNFKLISLTENRIVNKKISGLNPTTNSIEAFKKANVVIDFTVPKCTIEILKIASKLKKRVVIGTTGFSKKDEVLIKKFSKKIPILKAGNMSLGVNLLMYLTEITSKSLGKNFLSKIYEVHHKHKIDYPSGTALMLGKGVADGLNKNLGNLMGKKYLNKKSFPYSKKINFNSIRKGEVIGEHEIKFSSGKEIITLNHESFDRALYSEGALTAATWLMSKKAGLYSMRDLLNFK